MALACRLVGWAATRMGCSRVIGDYKVCVESAGCGVHRACSLRDAPPPPAGPPAAYTIATVRGVVDGHTVLWWLVLWCQVFWVFWV